VDTLARMSQDGRYKNFACRQRLVQNPNYVDQESKAATKSTGSTAVAAAAAVVPLTGTSLACQSPAASVKSASAAHSSPTLSSFNHNSCHNSNGPPALSTAAAVACSNHESVGSTGGSNHHNNGTLSTAALIELGQHRLQYRYNLWFSKRLPGKLTSSQFYDQTLKLLATFGTIEQYWSIYSYLLRPSDLPGHFDFHLFKEGIKPMWEDEANKRGGKWIIRLKKGSSSRCWENLVLAILGTSRLSLNLILNCH
jgi:hypothetical protein